jgi:hypothetical protein
LQVATSLQLCLPTASVLAFLPVVWRVWVFFSYVHGDRRNFLSQDLEIWFLDLLGNAIPGVRYNPPWSFGNLVVWCINNFTCVWFCLPLSPLTIILEHESLKCLNLFCDLWNN